MYSKSQIDWHSPLDYASGIENDDDWVLLYSGLDLGFSGGCSLLALKKTDEIIDNNFDRLESVLSNDKEKFSNAWFGYLGYGLKNVLEHLPEDTANSINMPDLWFIKFGLIMVFDHRSKTVEVYYQTENFLQYIPKPVKPSPINIKTSKLASNMDRKIYIDNVGTIIENIKSGVFYQANLTRKFFGEIEGDYTYFDIFCKLAAVSPAPYSTFMKLGDKYIISSSPERYINIDADGNVDTRPIKGSKGRLKDPQLDREAALALANSAKDKAENLMIVDLSRNDLARNCKTGSVIVRDMFEITSYATVHHMVSTVQGKLQDNKTNLDLIKGAFPPGSMTGTPKIKAMEICSHLERQKRGVYSGGIGFFGGDGSCDLSVVIRTIIMRGNKFEFQVGGAIVYDSTPESELEETIVKARAIARVLNINESDIENL